MTYKNQKNYLFFDIIQRVIELKLFCVSQNYWYKLKMNEIIW